MFEDLFLTEREEKQYQLERLEKQFILSEKDMLDHLRKKAVNSFEITQRCKKDYFNYKKKIKQQTNKEE